SPGNPIRGHSKLFDQARHTSERLERRRSENAAGMTVTPGKVLGRRSMGSASMAGGSSDRCPSSIGNTERLESLYQDAKQRNLKLKMAMQAEAENPRDCTFAPEIIRRARGRSRGRGRGRASDEDGVDDVNAQGEEDSAKKAEAEARAADRFDALYMDAK
ncbi:unnamed protein product, partial [Choristocarpus tenellus]